MNDLPDPIVPSTDEDEQLSPSVRRHLAALAKSMKTAERDALTPEGVDSLELRVSREARRFSHEDKVDFIAALYQHHNVHRACLATGISRRGALKVRARDPLFADAWYEALASHVDDIEDHVMTQAKTSKAPLWAIFALKAHRPDLYGDKLKVDQTQETEVTVVIGGAPKPQDAMGGPSAHDIASVEEGISPPGLHVPGSEAWDLAGGAGSSREPQTQTPKEPGAGAQALLSPGSTPHGSTYVDSEDPEQEDG